MNAGRAYGGGKAGASFDPITFVQRPQVILRGCCWLFSIIVFGCISSQGWRVDETTKKDICLYNNNPTACNYGVTVGVIGFLASMGFIAGEYFFEQMSSVKTRKHYVLGDLGFSALWAFLCLIGFKYLWGEWSNAEAPPMGYGDGNVKATIFFLFLLIGTWGGCAYFAYQRFQQGVDVAFASTYDASDPAANQYSSYPIGNETDQYNEPPFANAGQQQQRGGNEYQAPTY
ncbi:synaptogyrin [Contarinia nasturtii]|uniref:synaptogyrin n=1 Tax=Contarinia nasturtii TaxID=265458 RepID=UPI0012D40011|nr:synaptogyrin [Contarinia nasturtii]XP_031640259.1 synaptogyrin [Contarinia nasturtii]